MNNKLKINYHVFEKCNMKCKFCFRNKRVNQLDIIDYKKVIELIKKNDLNKKINHINLVGGEVTLYDDFYNLLQECNKNFDKTSIVTNGIILATNKKMLINVVKKIDTFGLSIDSLDENINKKIGRSVKEKSITYSDIKKISDICKKYNIKFKINIVVNSLNLNDKTIYQISNLEIDRIKILKNQSEILAVTKEEFDNYCLLFRQNVKCKNIVIEDNMTDSYFMVTSEKMFSLNNTNMFDLEKDVEIFNEKIDFLLNSNLYQSRYK